MKAVFERKVFNLKALDIDTAKRIVKIAVAETESIDSDKDLIVPTAFNRTIKAKGPAGSNEIWHLLDHDKTFFSALSKPKEIFMEGKYLAFVSPYRDTFAWREVAWPLYEAGDVTQHSIGFATVNAQKKSNYRELIEIALYEGSAVLWGANSNTPTLGITKSINKQELALKATDRLDFICKQLKSGKYTEDDSLLFIELKQIQQILFDLSNEASTPPDEKSTAPDSEQERIDIRSEIKDTIKGLFN